MSGALSVLFAMAVWLAGLGITRIHSMVFFLSVLISSVSWNWIYNRISLAMGNRLSCNRKLDEKGTYAVPRSSG